MAEDKYDGLVHEAEGGLDGIMPENPDLSQVYMLRGIGYAMLAVAHELRIIEQILSKETKK